MTHQKNTYLTSPTDQKFHDLFHPIAPAMHSTGMAAQFVSGCTEFALVAWLVTNQLSTHWALEFFAAGIAGILVVAVLEVGGRKFAQVLTRQVVGQHWKTVWHWLLFFIVGAVFAVIVWQSFTLSTGGVKLAFTPAPTPLVDTAPANAENLAAQAELTAQHDLTITQIRTDAIALAALAKADWDIKIQQAKNEADNYKAKAARGEKWAGGHAKKWDKKALAIQQKAAQHTSDMATKTSVKIDGLNIEHRARVAALQKKHDQTIKNIKTAHHNTHSATSVRYNGYGALLAGVVGLCVVLAFVCIITVEIYHRGAGMEVVTTDGRERQLQRLTTGLGWRWWLVLRWAADLATPQMPVTTSKNSTIIGFSLTGATIPANGGDKPTQGTQGTHTGINDAEILNMAYKNARGFVAAYKAKNATPNNLKRLEEWTRKAEEIKSRIS